MTPSFRAARALYRAATALGGPIIAGYLRRRRDQGKEDAARFGERFGQAGRPRPDGRLVWLHAASIGEAFSVLRLIDALLAERDDISVLITTGTVTSAQLLADRLPPRAIHQYVPVDRMAWVRRFLDHWRPDLALWVESEIWPNLIGETTARGVPMVLVNARLSPKSFEGWRRWPAIARELFGGFALCLAQDAAEAERLHALGARAVTVTGNLKHAAEPLPADESALAALRAAIAGRPVWAAASTHDGEEALVATAHVALAARHPGLLTLVVPRHPARAPAIVEALGLRGLAVARRSLGALPGRDTAVYLVDTLGELGMVYRAAPVAFVGGSLVPHGGQNILEPARLDAAIVTGPHTDNFRAIADEFEAAGALTCARDAATLADAVDRLLGDEALRRRQTAAAAALAATQDHVLDRVMDEVRPYLARGRSDHARP